jgi:hypothetical protein
MRPQAPTSLAKRNLSPTKSYLPSVHRSTGVVRARNLERHSIRVPYADQEPVIHDHRRAHLGSGRRSKHGGLRSCKPGFRQPRRQPCTPQPHRRLARSFMSRAISMSSPFSFPA